MARDLPDLSLVRPELKALFKSAGAEPGLTRILNDFYQKMSQDILIGFFFNEKDLNAIAEKQKQFLMRAMGATPSYSGKAPAQAHMSLAPILTGHFDRRLMILEQTLADHGLTPAEIQVWLSFENAFRDAVVKSH
jgi:hemoglobin